MAARVCRLGPGIESTLGEETDHSLINTRSPLTLSEGYVECVNH